MTNNKFTRYFYIKLQSIFFLTRCVDLFKGIEIYITFLRKRLLFHPLTQPRYREIHCTVKRITSEREYSRFVYNGPWAPGTCDIPESVWDAPDRL